MNEFLDPFPCECGHAREDHPKIGKADYIVCESCFRYRIRMAWPQLAKECCKVYKPDNLKYLEKLYEKKAV